MKYASRTVFGISAAVAGLAISACSTLLGDFRIAPDSTPDGSATGDGSAPDDVSAPTVEAGPGVSLGGSDGSPGRPDASAGDGVDSGVPCQAGTDCSDAGSCGRMVVDCPSGQCIPSGNQPNGSACGDDLYCNAGTCAACTSSAPCSPTANPCNAGTTDCDGGVAACLDLGAPANPGTPCSGGVCDGTGKCNPCAVGTTCFPIAGNPCVTGTVQCGSGMASCGGTLSYAGAGATCDDGNACTSGDQCNGSGSCAGAEVTCPANDACGTYACNGTATCTGTYAPAHDACGNGNVCDGVGKCGCDYPGLLAYFNFEDATATTVPDVSGNGNTATGANYRLVAGQKFGTALQMNEASSVLSLSEAASGGYVWANATGRTFCAWVQPAANTSGLGLPIISGGVCANAYGCDFFGIQPTSLTPDAGCYSTTNHGPTTHFTTPNVVYNDDNGARWCASDDAGVVANSIAWSFVCFDQEAQDGGTALSNWSGVVSIFLNGVQTPVQDVSQYRFWPYPLSTVSIGSAPTPSGSTQPVFEGLIDEVSVWNVSLSTAQMTALYNGGGGCACN